MNNYIEWFKKNKITEVECLIPDNSGIPRGKILPTKKFLSSFESGGLRLPLHLFKLAVSRSVSYSIDDQLFLLIQKRFPQYKITKEDYIKNIDKIENLFFEAYQTKYLNAP